MTPERLLALAVENRELVVSLVTLLAGTAGGVRHYRRTGQLPLSTLPWRAFRRLAYAYRRRFHTVKRPRKNGFHITDPGLEEIRQRLGQESFEPGWPWSYRYKGEDLNCRRHYFWPGAKYTHRQIHIRGFELDDGIIELIAHEEPVPKHHPRAHLEERDMRDATPWLKGNWEGPALDPRTFDRQ